MNKNYSNPFVLAKWIRQLQYVEDWGFLLKKNLKLDRGVLGFTFNSNKYGLRGPHNQNSNVVILGTSYAMGFGVDIGSNWYECNKFNNAFNASIPLGTLGLKNVLLKYYNGDYEQCILLFHPNVIVYTINDIIRIKNNLSFKEFYKWRTDYISLIRLLLKKKIHKKYLYKNKSYSYSENYCFIKDTNYIDKAINKLVKLITNFKKVIIVRVLPKEYYIGHNSIRLSNTLDQYDLVWAKLSNKFNDKRYLKCEFHPSSLECFNQFDNHWNIKGNEEFREFILHLLD